MDKCRQSCKMRLQVTLVCVACILASGGAGAQVTNGIPDKGTEVQDFEVATIKPHPAGDQSSSMGGRADRYEARNVTVKMLIEAAFSMPADQISGGPPWMEQQRFDVTAKVADSAWDRIKSLRSGDQYEAKNVMLQGLLKERFGLVFSHQPKELTVYALVQARGGAKLRPHGAPKPPEKEGRVSMMATGQQDAPVSSLAKFLAGYLRRTVVDQTGLEGRFDFDFAVPIPEDNTPDARDTSLFQALEDQLGLKLVSKKATVDTLHIEKLEEPSEN